MCVALHSDAHLGIVISGVMLTNITRSVIAECIYKCFLVKWSWCRNEIVLLRGCEVQIAGSGVVHPVLYKKLHLPFYYLY